MGTVKKIIFICAVSAAIITIGIFLCIDRIAVAILVKRYNLDIAYKSCSKKLTGELIFKDLSVVSKYSGLGIASGSADIRPIFRNRHLLIGFDLRDGSFIKKRGDEALRYDTLTAIVASPFNSKWRYRTIKGEVEPTAKDVKILGLEAVSDDIRLSMTGELAYNGAIKSDITIYFAASMLDKISPELANTVFTNRKDGWKSIAVRLSGDPNKPSIQVSSKSFRLSISPVASGT